MRPHNLVVVFKGKSIKEAIYYVARDISKILNIPLITLHSNKDVIVLLKRLKNTKTVLYIGALSTLTIFKITILSILLRRKIIIYALQHGAVRVPLFIAKMLRLKSIIVTPSNYLKNELKKSGLSVDYVIPHGIIMENTHPFQSLKGVYTPQEHDRIRVLSVYSTLSQLRKRLGLYYLMCAWSKLPAHLRERSTLVLKVPRDQRFIVNKFARLLKLRPQKDYIVIDRYLPPSEMKELYLSADIYVHCVLADSFGLPIVEALSYGIPVIALDAPPWNEIVTEEVGWLVKVKQEFLVAEKPLGVIYRLRIPDVGDLIEKLSIAIRFCQDPKKRNELRAKCVRYALNKFDAYSLYKKMLNLVIEL